LKVVDDNSAQEEVESEPQKPQISHRSRY